MSIAFTVSTTMAKGKRLGFVLRLLSLFLGFGLICLGAYVKSLDGGVDISLPAIFAYILVAFGFLLLLVGAFWSIFHGMRTNLYRRGGNRSRRASNQVYIYTVDRPSFFPPSYEESQARGSVVIPVERVCVGMAPPLYTPSSSEVVNEDFSHELPPSYHLAVSQNLQSPDQPLRQDARLCQHNSSDAAVHQ